MFIKKKDINMQKAINAQKETIRQSKYLRAESKILKSESKALKKKASKEKKGNGARNLGPATEKELRKTLKRFK